MCNTSVTIHSYIYRWTSHRVTSQFTISSLANNNMQLFFILFTLAVSAAYAEDAPYPPSGWRPQQQALLVLPPRFSAPANNFQAPQDEAENLEKINENVMERLRQEEGSERGVYYVYLPDGKLQRVQYTTAPVKQQDAQQNANQQQESRVNYQQQQYRPNQFNRFPNNNVQTNHQQVGGNNQNSFQGNQQQFGRYQQQSRQQDYASQAQQEQQYNGYQPQNNNGYQPQFGESNQQSYHQFQGNQYLAPNANQQQQQNADNKEAESGDPSQLLARYTSPEKLQNPPASSYVASVQFTDVPPITGPIYSYNPAPLVRIVRYANNYQ